MTIGGVDVGSRERPATIAPSRIVSVGYSMAGSVQQYDFGLVNQLVDVALPYVSNANRLLLQVALEETALPGGAVAVVPDTGDDLGVGAPASPTSTDFYYVPNSFRATIVKPGYWRITLTLRYMETA